MIKALKSFFKPYKVNRKTKSDSPGRTKIDALYLLRLSAVVFSVIWKLRLL